MHPRVALAAAGLFAGCTGGTYNQGTDLGGTTDDTAAAVDDTGAGGAAGGGSGGGDTGGGDDTGGPTACSNAWHPVDRTGWTKQFSATYQGGTGTETESAAGAGDEPDTWIYEDILDTSNGGWNVRITVGCDVAGEGMFVLSWSGTYSTSCMGIPISGPIEATLDPYRRYLPPEYAVGAEGTWDYEYRLHVVTDGSSGGGQPMDLTASGTFVELGMEDYALPDGTMAKAYKLSNTYTLTSDDGLVNLSGYIEQLWVKGIGLVWESHTNLEDGSEFQWRQLSSYSGLEPE